MSADWQAVEARVNTSAPLWTFWNLMRRDGLTWAQIAPRMIEWFDTALKASQDARVEMLMRQPPSVLPLDVDALARSIHEALTVTAWHPIDGPCVECQKIGEVLRR